jgi:hypothetical protein
MSIYRRLVDAFRSGRALAERPSQAQGVAGALSSPGHYGMTPAATRPNGSGDVPVARLVGQSDVKFSAGEDFQLSRKPVPPVHDTRGNPAGSTASARDASRDLPYGEHVAPARPNAAWGSDSAHTPSKALDAPRSGTQSASDGKVRR